MKLLQKIKNYFAPTCECGQKMKRHHTDLIDGTVYWWCPRCKKKVHF